MLENNKHMTVVLQILNIKKELPRSGLEIKVKLQCSCGSKYYATTNLKEAYKKRCDLCEATVDIPKYSPQDVGEASVEILSYMLGRFNR